MASTAPVAGRWRVRGLAVVASIALLTGGLWSLPSAQAATVSTTTINCDTDATGNVTVPSALASGDSLTINYKNCQNYTLTWSSSDFAATFADGGSTRTSPFVETAPGSNTLSRTLNTYAGSVAAGGTLATLAKAGDKTFTIVQAAASAWTAKSPTAGVVGTAYSYVFTTSTGTGTFSVSAGSLPAGLTLATDGTLSGTPTRLGSYTFTVSRSDVGETTGSLTVSITAPVVTKVTICHRTKATTNPYRMITVSVNSIDGGSGHGGHNTTSSNQVNPQTNASGGSGVFSTTFTYPSNKKWWGDIIPPFSYSSGGSTTNYTGLNWSASATTPNPSSGTATWLQPAEFAAAASNSTDSSWKDSVGTCMDLSATPVSEASQSADVNTPDKYFKKNVENGEDPADIKSDLDGQSALPNDGSSDTAETVPSASAMQSTYETSNATVKTNAASSVGQTSASLNGTLSALAGGATWSSAYFAYATSRSGTYTNRSSLSASGSSAQSVADTLTGLTCGTTYYYRIVGQASTPSTPYQGLIKSFSTSACSSGGGGSSSGTSTPTPAARPVTTFTQTDATPLATTWFSGTRPVTSWFPGTKPPKPAKPPKVTTVVVDQGGKVTEVSSVPSGTTWQVTAKPTRPSAQDKPATTFTTSTRPPARPRPASTSAPRPTRPSARPRPAGPSPTATPSPTQLPSGTTWTVG